MSTESDGSRGGSKWWILANSPLAILIVSGMLIGGGAKLYSDQQEIVRDQVARRSTLSTLLVEYRNRLSALESLDAELSDYLGPGPGITKVEQPFTETRRAAFEKLSLNVGRREVEVIQGRGHYVPTSPSFANVNIQVVAAQIEDAAGIPNLYAGSLQLLGVLNADANVIWIFIRAYVPLMTEFYVNRHMMTINGELPLPKGAELTAAQETKLGIPQPKPGELERLKKESDARHAEIQSLLRKLEADR